MCALWEFVELWQTSRTPLLPENEIEGVLVERRSDIIAEGGTWRGSAAWYLIYANSRVRKSVDRISLIDEELLSL
jgi:hypothetical protein